jgi:hypothetical protein
VQIGAGIMRSGIKLFVFKASALVEPDCRFKDAVALQKKMGASVRLNSLHCFIDQHPTDAFSFSMSIFDCYMLGNCHNG